MGRLSEVLVVLIIFYFIYQIIKLLVHRKERLMMVEKMEQNPDLLAQHPDLLAQNFDNRAELSRGPYTWLKPAGLVIGLGIGCILAYVLFLNNETYISMMEKAPMPRNR